MPLPRILKAKRWFAERPPPAPLIRAYLGVKEPEPARARRPVEYSSEEEILGLAGALGMRKAS